MKVVFKHKSGRSELMNQREADILQKLKRGTYQTKDMQARPVTQEAGSVQHGATDEPIKKQTRKRQADKGTPE
ncbi:hypothetical protein E8K88_16410 [Lampropedia aestuarii]|uniref:Uncharacterized protein n=1 Tax=Lampropedia aestuarii TaxID=2562762 RepID=A0A4S5BML1_9BURK|nr:hypothetical protein [Lampropedia aestuarii]THJ30948.1 hypothetical protein E8K88_16410 [Lampropedia aestuarii]